MIFARNDYNGRIVDSQNLISETEPVFLLRGQDLNAADAVEYYAQRNMLTGGDPAITLQCFHQADAMRTWQKTVKCKMADLPKEK